MGKKINKSIADMGNNFVFLIKFIYRINKSFLLWCVVNVLIKAVEPFILIGFSKLIFDELTIGGDYQRLVQYIGFMGVTMLAIRSMITFLNAKLDVLTTMLQHKIDEQVNYSMMKIDFHYLEQSELRDTFQRVKQNSKNTINAIYTFVNIISCICVILGVAAIITNLGVVVIGLIGVTLLIKVIGDRRSHMLWEKTRRIVAPLERKGLYVSNFGMDHSGAKEVRLNNLKQWLFGMSMNLSNQTNDIFLSQYKVATKFQIFTYLSLALQVAVTYYFLVTGVIQNQLTIGDFSMYLLAVTTLSNNLTSITSMLMELQKHSSYIKDYKFLLNIPYEKTEHDNTEHLDLESNYYKITFENVSFKYPNTERYVLQNINLEIEHGEKISVVGKNGSGKTTFVKLLCGLYEVTEGRILLNGTDIKMSHHEYVKLLSAVFQDYTILSFSLKDNIVLNNHVENEELESLIEKCGLYNRYKSLPRGLDTCLYKDFDDDGIELSGGEMQKVALARALCKQSPIIILDEPTASLDPIAEYELYSKFNELTENKTAIFISHRLSSTRFTDRIFVFDDGRIVECGNHEELFQQNGLYTDMFHKQSHYYVDKIKEQSWGDNNL